MMDNEKEISLEALEKLYQENPQDSDMAKKYADVLVDELIYELGGLTNTDSKWKKVFNKLKQTVKSLHEEQSYYYNAFILFHNGDRESFFKNISLYIKNYAMKNNSFECNELVSLFGMPFAAKNFKGMWQTIAGYVDEAWPGCAAALTMFGFESYCFGEDQEKAIALFMAAVQADEGYWIALVNIAEIYYNNGLWHSAIPIYKRALDNEDNLMKDELLFNLGWCYGKLKIYEDEEEAYRNCIEINPEYPYARNNHGWVLMKLKKYAEALAEFETCIEKGIDGNYPFRNKVKALKRLGKFDEAIAFIKECMQRRKLPKSMEKEITDLEERIRKSLKAELDGLTIEDEYATKNDDDFGGEEYITKEEYHLPEGFDEEYFKDPVKMLEWLDKT